MTIHARIKAARKAKGMTVGVLNGGSAVDVLGRVVLCWNGRKL